ncbi:MAG: hypothetical protein RIA71_13785 [Oceanicaulis sp.]
MRLVRRFELVLAALVAGGASFAALAPGALSAPGGSSASGVSTASSSALSATSSTASRFGDRSAIPLTPPEIGRVSAADFADIDVSDASRAVAASVMSREARAARFITAPPRAEPGAGAVRISPRASVQSGAAWSGEALGLEVSYAPPAGPNEPKWWLVGGAGRESYAVAAGGLREFTVAPVSASTTVGDSHLGVAMEISDHAYASVGYVREVRNFTLGTQDWEEEEHYLGVGLQARW